MTLEEDPASRAPWPVPTMQNYCQRCGKWNGAHATLPGQSVDHLCHCTPPKLEPMGLIGRCAVDSAPMERAAVREVVLPEPVAWLWRNKKTGGMGVYFEDPARYFSIDQASDYEWVQLHTADQLRAAVLADRAEFEREVQRMRAEHAKQIGHIWAEEAAKHAESDRVLKLAGDALEAVKRIDETGLYRDEIVFEGSGRYAVDIDALNELPASYTAALSAIRAHRGDVGYNDQLSR